MTNLTHASQKLVAFVQLLQTPGCLELTANVKHLQSEDGLLRPELLVEFEGPDTPLLTARNGELLHAIEHLAAKVLGLESDEHDRISFDADNFKAKRLKELERLATDAVLKVKTTATAYIFPPMMSRERRLLHLALASSGLRSASSGESSRRFVVLYPEGVLPRPE